MTIIAPVMFNDELDMLECRLTELEPYGVWHVLVEAPETFRGHPKPMYFAENAGRFRRWSGSVSYVAASLPPGAGPWARLRAQRNAAWPVIDRAAADDDVVLITDVDELPSPGLLAWSGRDVAAVMMRTFLFAADWESCSPLPPTCVVARAGYLRRRAAAGHGLAEVRDARAGYEVLPDGGWHLSWMGGPDMQRSKLETATCHTELLASPEGELIRSGARYRSAESGGGLPVVPAEVDETFPRYIRERCPASWLRPRG